MKRKPIRLTQTSYAVLALFEHLGEATSYDLKQAIEISIENFWQVPHTTAYDEPARLATGGYLTVRQEPGGRRRKLYALTDLGREALRAWTAEPVAAPPQLRDEADAEGLRRRRPGAAAAARGAPGTRRSSPSWRACSRSCARRTARRARSARCRRHRLPPQDARGARGACSLLRRRVTRRARRAALDGIPSISGILALRRSGGHCPVGSERSSKRGQLNNPVSPMRHGDSHHHRRDFRLPEHASENLRRTQETPTVAIPSGGADMRQ